MIIIIMIIVMDIIIISSSSIIIVIIIIMIIIITIILRSFQPDDWITHHAFTILEAGVAGIHTCHILPFQPIL